MTNRGNRIWFNGGAVIIARLSEATQALPFQIHTTLQHSLIRAKNRQSLLVRILGTCLYFSECATADRVFDQHERIVG